MKDITTRFLKLFSITLISICSSLSILATPTYEHTSSVLSINKLYNTIPYKENIITEVAIADDYKNIRTVNSDNVAIETFVGTVTAYGPDCVGCSGITASGYDVRNTITYTDKEYGELRIFAAANTKFPMGTIIRLSGNGIDGYITGIVLDTGGAMRNEWAKGNVLLDLLFPSERDRDVYIFGRKRNITIDVLRYGY